ncbi:hypothetical protein WME94_35420 [Sorangium sp. So ce429]
MAATVGRSRAALAVARCRDPAWAGGESERSLVKLDASGAELWRRTFTDVAVTIRELTTERDGNIALVGDFTGTADFGTGPLTAEGKDGFVAVFGP